MTVDSFITSMRAKQAALFETTMTFVRAGAAGAFKEDTASYAAPTSSSVYSGSALMRPDRATIVDAGGTSVEVDGYLVKLPPDTDVRVGDVGTVNASTHDAGLVDRTVRAIQVQPDEWQIARRVFCVDQVARPT